MKSRCVVLHAGALGDCVLTLHIGMAVRALGYEVTFAARSPIASWASRRAVIDEALPLDRLSPLIWSARPPSLKEPIDEFREFELVISFLGGPGEEAARRLDAICPCCIIHIDPKPSEATIRSGTHITQQWAAEICTQVPDFRFEISDLLTRSSNKLPNYNVTKLPNLLIHSGSGGRAKYCPVDAMEALMRELLVKGWQARWMIGPDEMERDGPSFRQRLERTAPVIFEESVGAAADLVAKADAYIGNDAGMTHVAALVGVNTVALFGPTDPKVWRPLGSNCRVVLFPVRDEPNDSWVASVIRAIEHNAQKRKGR